MRIIGLIVTLVLTGCLPQYYAVETHGAAYGTGVYINGVELTAEQKTQLDELVGGPVPAGRYTVDAQGNAGPEGQAPVVNLYALAPARGGSAEVSTARGSEPTQIYSRDAAGRGSSYIADGDCIMVSTPDISMDTGC